MSNPYAPPPGGPRSDPPTGDTLEDDGHGQSGSPSPAPVQDPAPRRPVDPEAARAASRQVLHFALMMLATLVTVSLPFPWQAAALVFAIGAGVLGVRALRAVWRSGVRGAMLAVVGAGLGITALMAVSLVTMLALWPVQAERHACLRDALTISARAACDEGFTQRLDETLQRVTGGSGS